MRLKDICRVRLVGPFCVYCGEPQASVEYFPPATLFACGYLLPSCVECNSLAGTTWPVDFVRRAAHVKDEIAKRHGGSAWQERSSNVLQRLAWNALAYLSVIDRNSVFVQNFVEVDFFARIKAPFFDAQDESLWGSILDRQCDECGGVLAQYRSQHRFCSPACKQKAYRKRLRPLIVEGRKLVSTPVVHRGLFD